VTLGLPRSTGRAQYGYGRAVVSSFPRVRLSQSWGTAWAQYGLPRTKNHRDFLQTLQFLQFLQNLQFPDVGAPIWCTRTRMVPMHRLGAHQPGACTDMVLKQNSCTKSHKQNSYHARAHARLIPTCALWCHLCDLADPRFYISVLHIKRDSIYRIKKYSKPPESILSVFFEVLIPAYQKARKARMR
jgi:hypothetical protein